MKLTSQLCRAIHVSSVAEWAVAMGLFWKYADVTGDRRAQYLCSAPLWQHFDRHSFCSGNQRWKGFVWGMMPLLGGALCACTYHFFYNAPELDILVVLQAALTVVGNFTMWWAAYRVFQTSAQTS